MRGPKDRETTFSEWLDQHRGLLFKVVRAYATDRQDQEDLFQEVTLQVWESIPRYRGQSAVSTWIYRVALYSALAWSRKERRHRDDHGSIETAPEKALLQMPETTDPRLDWIYRQISRLNEIDRSLALLMLDGFSYREIATTLGITESNVGLKWSRIKKRWAEKSAAEATRP